MKSTDAQTKAAALSRQYATDYSLNGEQRTQLAEQIRDQVATVRNLERAAQLAREARR